MSDTKDPELTIVGEAKARYEMAKNFYADQRQLAIEDTKFALGDSDNGWQWPEAIYKNRALIENRPCLTVNITAQHCNQIINNIRMNRPQARVLPVDNNSDKKTAEILAGLLRNIQTSSNAEDAHDTAAEHCIYGGEGYWRVITEYESERSFNQCIRIKVISNPLLVYVDPYAKELDKSDAEWGFIFEDISREECKRLYPGVDPESWITDDKGWVNQDTIRIAEYFYCDYVNDTACMMSDGSFILKSELHPHFEQHVVKERPTKVKKWKWCKLLGGEEKPVDSKDWPGKYLPIISVIGKEINVDGEVVRKGIVRDLKDPARMVNYSYSAAIETVALQNKVPYMAPVEAIEGYEDIWGNANNTNRAYLPYNAFDENGETIPMPQRQPAAVMPSSQVQMLQLSTEQMRAASGQQNANFGIKSDAVSGVGIQRLKAQGEVATFHFPDNQVRGLRYEARVLIDLIPKIYDTQRVVRILGLDGKDSQAVLDPDYQAPYGDIQMEDIKAIFNPTMGEYDVVIDTGPSYQTQRQEAAEQLTDLATKNPQLMQVAGDLIVRSYDFPGANEIANRLEKTLPPNLQDQKNGPEIPPAAQAQMDHMNQVVQQQQQQIQEMGAALANASRQVDKLEADRLWHLQENQIKAYSAETDRIQTIAAALTPEQVAALVGQTVQQSLAMPDMAPTIDDAAQQQEQAFMQQLQQFNQPDQQPEQAPQGAPQESAP